MNKQAHADIAAKLNRAVEVRDWACVNHWRNFIRRCLPADRAGIEAAIKESRS